MNEYEEEDLRMEITFYKSGILIDKELLVWEDENGELMAEPSVILPIIGKNTMAPRPISKSHVLEMTKKYYHEVDWR